LLLIIWLLLNATWQEAKVSAIAAGVGLAIYFGHRLTRIKMDRDQQRG
jgi:hypothetical protein